jgi:hypothetical protein
LSVADRKETRLIANHDVSEQKRSEALAQFKTAQKMLTEGRTDLITAQEKIEQAQRLIEHSSNVIRQTWSAARPGRVSKKK